MTTEHRVEPCRSCKALVVWAQMPDTKKWAPFDAKPERRFILHPGEDGILRAEAQPTYQSHFATCPQSKEWRKPKSDTPFTDRGLSSIGRERKDIE